MNYQATPPMQAPAPYQSVGAGQHVPGTGYAPPQGAPNLQQMMNMGSPEFANTMLFIAVGIFFLFVLDMIVKSAVAK